ncbi:hypothetical protein [Qipengyuania marisflavi]|uniref:hypothetical protein n=1 Tax=Qipengyuania marisflavi TaxID=2486356 RepID=UPI001CA43E7B|nr:hypothetical protein [Qipengyuania marisflavi]
MPDNKKTIEPLDAGFDEVARKMISPATPLINKNKALETVSGQSPATPKQLKLDLGIEVERVVGGIEMGVLENGIPYLTQRGLAEMTGAARRSIQEITEEWQEAQTTDVWRGRMLYFRDYLSKADFDEPRLFIEITKDGSPHYAYPDMVCMAMVEYFAFEAQRTNETAITNFRNLARYGLQKFIYDALGYVPEDPWKLFNARVSLLKDSVPAGYFSVFKESTGLVVDLINAGLPVNQHTIPDGSVGGTWGRHWTAQNLAAKYGERIEYPHYYPPEYPQSASNPQKANAYPNQAWPEFQDWFRSVYLRTKYPPYILKKAKMLSGGADEARQLAAMYEQKAIEG